MKSDELTIEYEAPQAWRAGRPFYGVYVLFNDPDAEPLGVEGVVDFDDRESVFFMVDGEGRRWFIPHDSYRWIEVAPMEAL